MNESWLASLALAVWIGIREILVLRNSRLAARDKMDHDEVMKGLDRIGTDITNGKLSAIEEVQKQLEKLLEVREQSRLEDRDEALRKAQAAAKGR